MAVRHWKFTEPSDLVVLKSRALLTDFTAVSRFLEFLQLDLFENSRACGVFVAKRWPQILRIRLIEWTWTLNTPNQTFSNRKLEIEWQVVSNRVASRSHSIYIHLWLFILCLKGAFEKVWNDLCIVPLLGLDRFDRFARGGELFAAKKASGTNAIWSTTCWSSGILGGWRPLACSIVPLSETKMTTGPHRVPGSDVFKIHNWFQISELHLPEGFQWYSVRRGGAMQCHAYFWPSRRFVSLVVGVVIRLDRFMSLLHWLN